MDRQRKKRPMPKYKLRRLQREYIAKARAAGEKFMQHWQEQLTEQLLSAPLPGEQKPVELH